MNHKRHIACCIAAVFLIAACKDSKTEGDGEELDASDPDIRIDEGADAMEDDIAPEGDIPQDVVLDETGGDEEIPPSCARQGIACGIRTNGRVGGTFDGNLDKYLINARPLEYDESGGEFIFGFLAEGEVMATAKIVDYSPGDLDIIILNETCSEEEAIAYGDSVVSFRTEAGRMYYIVVDGRDGTSGSFEIILECTGEFEICDNDRDDNDDGLVDCDDPQCKLLPPCFELYCADGADDDLDGDTDCEDFDCLGTASCAGGPGEIADPCDSHDDCLSGQCYMETETGWPGGYCIQISFIHHCDTMECPEGSYCEPLGFTSVVGPWVCARSCSAGDPCREGYLCEDHLCFPLCTSASQCVETGYCHYDMGLCTTEPTEICTGGVDDDGDGHVDCDDTECMFRFECETPTPLDGGDGCADAAALPIPGGERGTVVIAGSTEFAGDDVTPGCELIDSADVIYSFTITMPALARIDLEGGRIEPRIQDTILALRQDCEGADIACNNDISEGIYKHSFIEIELDAGIYYIIVDGFDGLTGDFNLGINLSDIP